MFSCIRLCPRDSANATCSETILKLLCMEYINISNCAYVCSNKELTLSKRSAEVNWEVKVFRTCDNQQGLFQVYHSKLMTF